MICGKGGNRCKLLVWRMASVVTRAGAGMKAKRVLAVTLCLAFAAWISFLLIRFLQTSILNDAARSGDMARVEWWLSTGAPVNGNGLHGMTPLMSACASGNPNTVEYLIDYGADVNGHNNSGSALMWAIDSGNVEAVELLLERDVDVSWKNSQGQNAVSFARDKGHPRIIGLVESAE
jgi:hypothetical protein